MPKEYIPKKHTMFYTEYSIKSIDIPYTGVHLVSHVRPGMTLISVVLVNFPHPICSISLPTSLPPPPLQVAII